MLYLDTSALLKLYVLEPGSSLIQSRIEGQDEPLPIGEFQEMELINALHLKVFWQEMKATDAQEQMAWFEKRLKKGLYFRPEIDRARLMGRFRDLSALTVETGCRTMDILHVALAEQIEADAFLSADGRQLDLARRIGLEVEDCHGTG